MRSLKDLKKYWREYLSVVFVQIILPITFIWLFLGCSVAHGQDKTEYKIEDLTIVTMPEIDTNLNKGGLSAIINKDEIAPYGGYLLNVESVASIVISHQSLLEAADLALGKQRELDLALLVVETNKLKIEMDAELKKKDVLIKGKEQEAQRLIKINQNLQDDRSSFWDDLLLVSGGIGGGLVVGIIVGLVATN